MHSASGQKYVGLAEGRAEGRAEGLAQGRTEGLAEGLAEGMKKGMSQGMEQGKAAEREANRKKLVDSARSMLADGLDVEKVMLYTGLTRDEIEEFL